MNVTQLFGLRRDDSVIVMLDRDETTIGRSLSNFVTINAMPVSRHHCSIFRIDGRYFLFDKATSNGTWIKKHRILPEREICIKIGDTIGIGCKPGENPMCTLEVVRIQTQKEEGGPVGEESYNHEELGNIVDEELRNVVDSTTDNNERKPVTPLQRPVQESPSSVETEDQKTSIRDSMWDISSTSKVSPTEVVKNIKESPSKLLPNSLEESKATASEEKPCARTSIFNVDFSDSDDDSSVEIVGESRQVGSFKMNSGNDEANILPLKIDRLKIEENPVDVTSLSSNVVCIDSSSEDERDCKPSLISAAEYSLLDDIIVLESDDEDFPRSELNATNIDDVPDLSSIFQTIYHEDDLSDDDSSINLNCTQDTWFESLSQPHDTPSLKKLIVDLPMINYQPKPVESDDDIPRSRIKKKKRGRVISPKLSKNKDNSEQNRVRGPSEGESFRSPPKRRISEDTVDDSVTPSKKKNLSDSSSSEHRSDTHFCSYAPETIGVESLQRCWVVLPSLVEDESEEVSVEKERETSKAYSSPRKTIQLDEFGKISSDREKKKKRKSETSTDELDSKTSWKEKRKEKLKEIASKKNPILSTSKSEVTSGPVAAKITKKSRSAHLMDSICTRDDKKDSKSSSHIKSFHSFRGDELIPETMRRREEEFHDSFLDDALDLTSQNLSTSASDQPDLNDEKASDETSAIFKQPKQPVRRIAHKKSESSEEKHLISESSHSKSKRKEHLSFEPKKHSEHSEPKKHSEHSSKRKDVFTSESKKQNEHSSKKVAGWSSESRKQKEDSLEKVRESTPSSKSKIKNEPPSEKSHVSSKSKKPCSTSSKDGSKRSNTAITFDIFTFEQDEKVKVVVPEITKKSEINIDKSKRETKLKTKPLSTNENVNEIVKKKRVRFYEGVPDLNFFNSDPEERRNNGIFAPRYKLNEGLIREELFEFEAAIAIACRWSVKWLEEQKMIVKPPPNLYKQATVFFQDGAMMAYKERLKEEMFLNLWRAIFSSYNKPERDFLPHTQYVLQGDRSGLYTLLIEFVDASRTASLWTIYATREMDEFLVKDDLINGQMVVLNFSVIGKGNQTPHKTMAFAYVASVNRIITSDGTHRQRIVLKIFQKDFQIVTGEIKIKVLTYTKTHLRPFQALAMIVRSPLTRIFLNESTGPLNVPMIHNDEISTSPYLDSTQKTAVNTCLNHIASPEPSICLVDGSPGCGKSLVIVSLLNELFSKRKQFPYDLKVLLIANSDNIADDLTCLLHRYNSNTSPMTLLRYGHSKNLNAKTKCCSLEDQINNLIENDKNNSLINLEEEERNLIAKKNSIKLVLESSSATEEKKTEAKLKLAALEREYQDLTSCESRIKCHLQGQAAKDEVIEKADVIVTSIHSCWSSSFENDFVPSQYNKGDVHKFTVCIFDDANYVEEISMLVPIMLMVRSLILVGDSKNMFRFREESRSPFLRLVRDFELKNSIALTKLMFQHRMHPHISHWFCGYYDLNFKPKPLLSSRAPLSLVPMLVIFLKVNIEKHYTSFERFEKQVILCCDVLEKIARIQNNDIPITVIVVTEREKEFFRNELQAFSDSLNTRVRVNTIEDICGRENEIVVICLPARRCDIDRWLYIACSRARSNLFVIGFMATLEANKSIQWMISTAHLRGMCHWWDADDTGFPENVLRTQC